ncbi:MerR family transcriptional regulator [Peribacillus muralis]|uniref:MerR family transcriptional regulator n=1 Tax=Peribacillus muralis TaxID=264697 RepID=A0A1B3XN47_9BACI|nr:MerR family transcriptional regulator [Peribacillus muralis]AOH54610.1 MerR family transcriptional regulator [Peribacillus muralis]
MYSISEVGQMLGISPHALRYYEKEEIITPERNAQGVRQYTDSQLKWMEFVKKLRETQMPIEQIKKYTQLFKEGDHTSMDRLNLLEKHRRTIESQIETLKTTEAMLDKKITAYKQHLSTMNLSNS